jgi:hypothetical protein
MRNECDADPYFPAISPDPYFPYFPLTGKIMMDIL